MKKEEKENALPRKSGSEKNREEERSRIARCGGIEKAEHIKLECLIRMKT